MALVTEDVQVPDPPRPAPSRPPITSIRLILTWAAGIVALAGAVVLALVLLTPDSKSTNNPAAVAVFAGDAKDHAGYGPVESAAVAVFAGDAKDHAGYGPRRVRRRRRVRR